MEKWEAEKIIQIMLVADGGCYFCAERLLEFFVADFGEFEDLVKKAFKDEFKMEFLEGGDSRKGTTS